MGKLTIVGIDSPTAPGQPDTFASKGFVSGAGDTNNSSLSITETFGAVNWQEYLVKLTTNPGKCQGAYGLDFRYSVVDTQGQSAVQTQSIAFQGPTDILLTNQISLDDSA
jgi:hypothetical protein